MTGVVKSAWLIVSLAALTATPTMSRAQQEPAAGFPHQRHADFFPSCATCHTGILEGATLPFPPTEFCQACHNGDSAPAVTWQPRSEPLGRKLRFTHTDHPRFPPDPDPDEEGTQCALCHAEFGAPKMAVQRTIPGQCLTCHGLDASHYSNEPASCATCHLPLAEASRLTSSDVAGFPVPASHGEVGFALGRHGALAKADAAGGSAVAASCATCHARDFCSTCHVNALETEPIQALQPDPRSLALATQVPVPQGHQRPEWLREHQREAERSLTSCQTCHTQENCLACHTGAPPEAVANIHPAGAGRADGPVIERHTPPSHTWEFRDRHGSEANARPTSCEGCHVRPSCLDCHRPDPSSGSGSATSFHPAGFLTRHPATAYGRDANCTDCHNTAQFCLDCHRQSGLSATRRLGGVGYHDSFRGFSLGHGQAARQSLESCVSCHVERDCTACHSAVGGGFRFSPHGPGFDAERLREKNPSLCVACHGSAIPRKP
jgi:hypothetical protein